jgi:hypothetical protein
MLPVKSTPTLAAVNTRSGADMSITFNQGEIMFRIFFRSMQQGLGVQIAFLSLLLGAISIPKAAAELPHDAISAERQP